ncbi:MAG: hypothetical protein ACKVOO_01910, partial [Burkholderiaceae bacterium]
GVYTVTFAVPAAGPVSATATITSTTADPSPTNNISVDSMAVGSLADVSVTVNIPIYAAPNSTTTGVITFFNNGIATASDVTRTVSLVGGTLTGVTGPGVVSGSGLTASFNVPSMLPNTSASFTFTYAIGANANVTATGRISTITPEGNLANNTATAVTLIGPPTATLSGRAFFDLNRDRLFDPINDRGVPNVYAELYLSDRLIGRALTQADGTYALANMPAGSGYTIRFRDQNGSFFIGTPFNQANLTSSGNASTGVTNSSVGAPAGTIVAGEISNVTLYPGDNVISQNLPLDPSGVVYDSVLRTPVEGAVVQLSGPSGFDPAVHVLGGTSAALQTVGVNGIYSFFILPNPPGNPAPDGVYRLTVTPPATHLPPNATLGQVSPPQGTFIVPNIQFNIQPQASAPGANVTGTSAPGTTGTQYFFNFDFRFTTNPLGEVRNNHIPLDRIGVLGSGAVLVSKTGNKSAAEVGDSVQYTIRVRNTTASAIAGVSLEDLLPAGFRYILGTARINSVSVPNPDGGVGRQLRFDVGTLAANSSAELTYFVRLGVGSQQGDGTNRVTALFPGPGGVTLRSNTALFKVNVLGGVFSNEGCITGKVFVDCDGNFVQNNDSGSRELGIPGVRIVMLDGTYLITDNEGKYSICGVKSQTHVLKVDRTTLPKGARLVPSSNRNAGVGDSIFVDLKAGELGRADFIEGSCTPELMDQVKQRRGQSGTVLPANDGATPTGERKP